MAKALPLPVVQSGLESSIDQVRRNIKPINVPVNVDPSAFKNLAQPLGRVSGLATEFEKSIAASNARVLAFGASVGIINGVQNAFASLLQTGIEVQKTLAEIAAISGQSGEALAKFGDSLFEVGKLTGQSFKTAAQAALEFSRQGLSTEETLKRTTDALTLTRFTTLNAAEAVDVLTAAANSFGDTGITTTEILNKLVAVDTKFAVSAEDLANGLARAGSIAQEVGVSFDELNAAITIAQERTARGGSVIGNALKTIFTRLRSDETVQALRAIGVESLNAQGGLKGAIPLLEEVAQKLEGLSEGERVQILEAIASKYNINILSAILTDLSDANKKFGEVVGISASAGNQAYERQIELNKILDAQINITTLSVQQLFNKLAEIGVTESLTNLLKFVNGLLDGINNLLDSESTGGNIAKGLIKGISEIFFTVGLPLLGAIFIKLTKDIAQFGVESLKTILGINQQVRERQALEQAVVNTLIRDQEIMATILSLSGNRAAQEEYLLSVYNKQLAALQQVQSIAAGVAPALQAAGLSATSGTVKRRAAEGYLPAAEARDVRRGVGGASPSSKVVEIPNFSFGGGKRGTMVANTSEYIVPNYAGGSGTAIFNQDMAKEYGLPPGAKKITASGGFVPASGFVPNFADSGLKGIGGLQGKELPYNVKKNLTPAEAKKVERYFEKTVVESAAKNPYEGQVDVAHILAGRIFESRAQGLEYIDLQENDPKPDIKSGPYSVAEAKLSYQAGLDDPRLAKGGEKGDKLLVPKTAKQDENINKKLSEKGVTAKKHGSIGHSFLFAKAKELIQRYRDTPREEIIKGIGGFGPNKIPIFDSGARSVSENASTGYIPNFINKGFVWKGTGERLEGYDPEGVVPAGNATRGKKWEQVKANYKEAEQDDLNAFAAKAAKQMNEGISVTAQHPAGAVMLVPKQDQAKAVNKDSQSFGFKPKDGLKTPEGEGINFVKFAAFGVNDEKFKSKSGAKMSDIQMRIKTAIGSIGADIANDFKVLTKEPLDKDGFYKLFDKKQGAGGSVSAVAGSIFEAATDYTLNPAGNPNFTDPNTSFDVGSLTPNLIDVFDIEGNYGSGTKADFKISEARARAFADQVVLNKVYKKIDKSTGLAKAAKGYIPNFVSGKGMKSLEELAKLDTPEGANARDKLRILGEKAKGGKTKVDLTGINPEYFEQQKKNYAYYMGLGFTKDASLNALQGVDRARGTSTIDQLPKLKTFKQKNPLLFTQLETFVKQPNGRTTIEKILKDNSTLSFQEPEKSAARGFVPSFAANEPLKEAINREVAAGVSPARVRVTQDDRLQNSKNPEGLAVINTRDEPNGKIPNNFRKRAAVQEVASRGFVPNFADLSKQQIEEIFGKSKRRKNTEVYTGGKDFDYGVKNDKKPSKQLETNTNKLIASFVGLQLATSTLQSTFKDSESVIGKTLTTISQIGSSAVGYGSLGSLLGDTLKEKGGLTGQIGKIAGQAGLLVGTVLGTITAISDILDEQREALEKKRKSAGQSDITNILNQNTGLSEETQREALAKRRKEIEFELSQRQQSINTAPDIRYVGSPNGISIDYSGKGTKESDLEKVKDLQNQINNFKAKEFELTTAILNANIRQSLQREQALRKEKEELASRISLEKVRISLSEAFAANELSFEKERNDRQLQYIKNEVFLSELQKNILRDREELIKVQEKEFQLNASAVKSILEKVKASGELTSIDAVNVGSLENQLKFGKKIVDVRGAINELGLQGVSNLELIVLTELSSLKVAQDKRQEEERFLVVKQKNVAQSQALLNIERSISQAISNREQANRQAFDDRFNYEIDSNLAENQKELLELRQQIASQPFATPEQEAQLGRLTLSTEQYSNVLRANAELVKQRNSIFRNTQKDFIAAFSDTGQLNFLPPKIREGFAKDLLDTVDLTELQDALTISINTIRRTLSKEIDLSSLDPEEATALMKSYKKAISDAYGSLIEQGLISNQQLDIAEKKRNIAISQVRTLADFEQKIKEIREKSPATAGFARAFVDLNKEAQGFTEKFSYDTTFAFRDGLRDALGAAISQTDDLNGALQDVALNFLKTMQNALLNNAVNTLMIGAGNAFPGVFGGLGKAKGGYIKGYASGGLVTGGSGYKDDVPAMLNGGEYVIRKSSVEKYGASNLQKLNSGDAPKFAAGGIFLPGVRGGTAISGYKDLTAFAKQTTTSGATDILMGGRSTAFASLEDQSARLSSYALLNEDDTINREIRSAQEQGLNLISEREKYRTQKRKAYQKQLVGTAISAALSFGLSKAFDTGVKSQVLSKQDYTPGGPAMTPYKVRGAYGGLIKTYSTGGGPTDNIPALLMDGEYVMSQKATRKYGKQFFDSINQGRAPRFADGGQVSTSEPSFAEKAAAMSDSKTTGATNVSININVTGQTSQMQTEGDPKQKGTDYKEMSKQIEQIVLKTIAEQKRAGGMLKPNR